MEEQNDIPELTTEARVGIVKQEILDWKRNQYAWEVRARAAQKADLMPQAGAALKKMTEATAIIDSLMKDLKELLELQGVEKAKKDLEVSAGVGS